MPSFCLLSVTGICQTFTYDVSDGTGTCHDECCYLCSGVLSNAKGDNQHGHELTDCDPQFAAGQLTDNNFLHNDSSSDNIPLLHLCIDMVDK